MLASQQLILTVFEPMMLKAHQWQGKERLSEDHDHRQRHRDVRPGSSMRPRHAFIPRLRPWTQRRSIPLPWKWDARQIASAR